VLLFVVFIDSRTTTRTTILLVSCHNSYSKKVCKKNICKIICKVCKGIGKEESCPKKGMQKEVCKVWRRKRYVRCMQDLGYAKVCNNTNHYSQQLWARLYDWTYDYCLFLALKLISGWSIDLIWVSFKSYCSGLRYLTASTSSSRQCLLHAAFRIHSVCCDCSAKINSTTTKPCTNCSTNCTQYL
jgi:hypothetical protein